MLIHQSNTHDPDRTTVGTPGQIYTNEATGEKWKCVAVYNSKAKDLDETVYFWVRQAVVEFGSSRVPAVTAADAGKILQVDASGNIVWGNLSLNQGGGSSIIS